MYIVFHITIITCAIITIIIDISIVIDVDIAILAVINDVLLFYSY